MLMLYLHDRWGSAVARQVESDVAKAMEQVGAYPGIGASIYGGSTGKRLVVNAHLSLIYEVRDEVVHILAIWQHVQRPEHGWTVEESQQALSALPQTRYLRSENPSYGRRRHYHGFQVGLARDATGSRCAA